MKTMHRQLSHCNKQFWKMITATFVFLHHNIATRNLPKMNTCLTKHCLTGWCCTAEVCARFSLFTWWPTAFICLGFPTAASRLCQSSIQIKINAGAFYDSIIWQKGLKQGHTSLLYDITANDLEVKCSSCKIQI